MELMPQNQLLRACRLSSMWLEVCYSFNIQCMDSRNIVGVSMWVVCLSFFLSFFIFFYFLSFYFLFGDGTAPVSSCIHSLGSQIPGSKPIAGVELFYEFLHLV